MIITIKREIYTPLSTGGVLFLDSVFECYTLEPRADQSFGKPYCVPTGTYTYLIRHSERFNRSIITVEDVPGFTAIEVHPGNFPSDTHGCCLVGQTEGVNFVGSSDKEYDQLIGKIPLTGQIEYDDSAMDDVT